MEVLKILLYPFCLLYGIVMLLRNKLFDWGLLTTQQFKLPVISVGNLSMGGTGKTPHIEYLIRLLKPNYYTGTLSRGYGRKTNGFILADTQSVAEEIGDEPLQFKTKFSNLRVAVDEDRVRGIHQLISLHPSLQVILLDDAFQHRKVTPGLSVLLTEFSKLYVDDCVLPSGSLREFPMGAKRADVIIVTKCPGIPLPIERERIIKKLAPQLRQKVFFSTIKYGELVPLNNNSKGLFAKDFYFSRNYTVLLVTGIADVQALEYYLKSNVSNVLPLNFRDHHQYSLSEIKRIENVFNEISTKNKIIITTEKDAMRLKGKDVQHVLNELPVFYIPIEIEFTPSDKDEFDKLVLSYVSKAQ